MARLSLYLLGPFHATLDGVAVTSFGYDHVRALLAYLAVESDRPHRREALAGLLWPDQRDQVALQNLRHALYRLQRAVANRQADPPFLVVSREALQFNVHSDHTLDVSSFEDLSATDGNSQGSLQRLERAVAVARGPFLHSFSLGSSYPLEEWLLQKREQLGRQLVATLHRLIEAYQRRGEYGRAEQHARRALELDPWDEHTHRQLMRVLALDGRRGLALVHYGALCELLREELGVEPEPETVALHARISGDQLGFRVEHPAPAPAPYGDGTEPTHTPFVGRQVELQRLRRCLDAALAGRGRVALVSGVAGSGKTALVSEFARRALATHPSLVVASGSCSTQGGIGDPYLPFREILQALSGDVTVPLPDGTLPHGHAHRQWAVAPEALQALVEVGQDLVHRLVAARPLGLRAQSLARQRPHRFDRDRLLEQVQELVARPLLTGLADAPALQADLFTQCTHVLQAIARAVPLLLVLDDLQWADSGTISLLFHLGRRLEGHRILVVGAYRSDEVAAGSDGRPHPLAAVVNEFAEAWGHAGVDLEQVEGREFVKALLDSEPNRLGARFRETLFRHTGGNALFTVEVLRDLKERGGLRRDDDLFWVEGPDLNWAMLPPRVEGAVAERMRRLPETLRTILSAASVEGVLFTAEVIARACGLGERQVLACLSRELGSRLRLVQAEGLVQRGGQTLARYRFHHHLFRQYLYDHLDAVERARLHGAVLEALEALHGPETEGLAGALALHAEAACLTDRAARYWLQAGQRAFSLSAHDEAVALFRRSLALLATLPDSAARARQEMAVQLALTAPLFVVRGWGARERTAAADRAYDLAARLGELDQHLYLLTLLANSRLARQQCGEALTFAQQLMPLAERSGDALSVAASRLILGQCLLLRGEWRAANAHLEQGLAVYPRRARRGAALVPGLGLDVQVSMHMWLGYSLGMLGYLDKGREQSCQALRLAEQLDHAPTLAVTLAMVCQVTGVLCGDARGALDSSDRLLRLAEEKGLPFIRSWGLLYRGWAEAMTGQAADTVPRLRAGLEALQQTGTVTTRPQMEALLVEAYLHAGRIEEGLAAVEAALAEAERSGERIQLPELLRFRGKLLLRKGEAGAEDAAAACFLRALELSHRQEARVWELRAAVSLGCLRQRQGEPGEARRILCKVYGQFTEGYDTLTLQEARRCLEQLACQ